MGIHAKSLNQLAHELEARTRPAVAPQLPAPNPPTDLAKSLEDFKQHVADLFGHHPAAQAGETEAQEPPSVERGETPTPVPAFYMDSTFGTRTRPFERAEVQKQESAIRLYSGFASRSDIEGKG